MCGERWGVGNLNTCVELAPNSWHPERTYQKLIRIYIDENLYGEFMDCQMDDFMTQIDLVNDAKRC